MSPSIGNFNRWQVPAFAKKVGFNSLSYGYGQLVTLVSQLVTVPFFLHFWGRDLYADWIVLTGLPLTLTLLDLGMSQASASRATTLGAAGKWDAARSCLQTGQAFTLSVTAVAISIAVSVNLSVDWTSTLHLSSLDKSDSRIIFLMMTGYLLVHFLCGPIDGYFRVIDRTALGAFLLANRRMLDVALAIGVLVAGGDPITLALAMMTGQALMLTLLVTIAKRLSERSLLGISRASKAEFRQIWKPSLAHAGMPIAQVIMLQGGIQLLNQLAPSAAVVAFSMTRTAMRLIMQIGMVISNSMKPELSRLFGLNLATLAKRYVVIASLCGIALSLFAYAVLLMIGPQLFEWWGGGKVSVSRSEMAMIGIHAVFNVSWMVPATYLIAANRHVAISSLYLISALLALTLWAGLRSSIPPLAGASALLAIPEASVALYLTVRAAANYVEIRNRPS